MKRATFLLLALASTMAFGQEKAKPEGSIVTDRPDFTESSVVVPYRWLQIETGLTFLSGRHERVLSGPEMLIRYGVAERAELRFGMPDYASVRGGGETVSGWGDFYIGTKYQFGPLYSGDDLAAIAGATVPSDGRFSSGAVDVEVALCWSRNLPGPWSVSAMTFAAWPTEGRTVTMGTISFARELTERSGMFLEYAGSFGEEDEHVAHAGYTFFPSRDTMFDVHAGFSLNGDARPFIAAGWSMRF